MPIYKTCYGKAAKRPTPTKREVAFMSNRNGQNGPKMNPKAAEALARARDWIDAAVSSPENIGTVYPDSPHISYSDLAYLVALIDGKALAKIDIPERGPSVLGHAIAA